MEQTVYFCHVLVQLYVFVKDDVSVKYEQKEAIMKKIGSRWIVNVTVQSSKEILKDEVHINHTYKNYEISKNHRKRFVAVRLFTIKRHIKPKRKNRYLMWTLAYQYRGTGSIPVLSITSGLRCLWFSPLNPRCFCRLTAFLPPTKVNYPNSKETVTKKSYFVNARGLIWFILMLYQKCSIYKSRASVSLTKYSVICKW